MDDNQAIRGKNEWRESKISFQKQAPIYHVKALVKATQSSVKLRMTMTLADILLQPHRDPEPEQLSNSATPECLTQKL